MKKLQLCNWLLAGTISLAMVGCQCQPRSAPSAPQAPCTGDDCPQPPESNSEDKVPCREDECDQQEAGEEAMFHVIEFDEPEEQKNAAVEAVPSESESFLESDQKAAAVIETSPDSASSEPAETTVQSQEPFESADLDLNSPSIVEETTQVLEDFPSSPISENTVVLSLEG